MHMEQGDKQQEVHQEELVKLVGILMQQEVQGDKEHPIVVVADGGGTATNAVHLTPKNGNYWIGGAGVASQENSSKGTAYNGQTIGGGLLVIYANNIVVGENGKFASSGKPINGSCSAYKSESTYMSSGAGGGSGGGSINIFFRNKAEGIEAKKFEVSTNAYSPKGSYNVGTIKTGSYVNVISSTK